MLVRWPRIVWHLTIIEKVESSAPKPAANTDGSLKRKLARPSWQTRPSRERLQSCVCKFIEP